MNKMLINRETQTEQTMAKKTESMKGRLVHLYPWLRIISAILVPLILAVFTIITSLQQIASDREGRQTDLLIATNQRAYDLYLAEELRRQLGFDTYHEQMSNLLTSVALLNATHDSPPLVLARARTLSTFKQLDGLRKGRLLRFLYEIKLLERFSMSGVDLDNLVFDRDVVNNF
jgi:hypothetical protein